MEMQTEAVVKRRERCADAVASLSGIGLRRVPVAPGSKDGDITRTLAAMPASPEILSDYDNIEAVDPPEMHDVTPQGPSDIVAWWNGLRHTQPMPSRDTLKVSDLVARWPNLILFRCGSVPGQLQPDNAFSTMLRAQAGGQHSGLPGGPEATAMLSQWMIRVANRALAAGAPVRDETRFENGNGGAAYRLDALPFGEDRRPDHILCLVQPC